MVSDLLGTFDALDSGLMSNHIFRDRPLRCIRWRDMTKKQQHDITVELKILVFSKYNDKLESTV